VFSLVTQGLTQGELQKMTARPQDPALAECLAVGHKLAQEGNLDDAVKAFGNCVEKFPNSSDGHFFLGMAHFYRKDLERAVVELKKALQADSDNLDATAMLGRIYSFDKQKLAVARELLERVIAATPHKDDVRFDLARVYAMTGEEKKSLQEFQTIFLGEARYGVYHTEFAKILIAAGEKKGARSHLMRARALAPDFEPAKKLLEQLDQEEKAIGAADGKLPPKTP